MSGTRSLFTLCAFLICANLPASPVQYGKLPLVFEPNAGQFDSRVRYAFRRDDSTLFLTDKEIVLAMPGASVRIEFAGGRAAPAMDASGLQPGVSNYFFGNDPSQWKTNVPHYSRVRYRDVYPGIDVVFYASGSDLEYDLIVKPGADPSAVHFAWHGSDSLRLDGSGDLIASAGGREIRLRRPHVFQQAREIASSYQIAAATGVIRLKLGAYDKARSMVIDPTLVYSTLLGGSNEDSINAMAVDGNGSVYVAGQTPSTTFPVTAGAFQTVEGSNGSQSVAFVTKLSADGSALVYSTYLGGTGGDRATAIAVDTLGNAHIAGNTTSANFPITAGVLGTTPPANGTGIGFVAELNASGSALVFSTYFAYSATATGSTLIDAMSVDATGNHYLAGSTEASDFPVTSGALQPAIPSRESGFVTKMNATGTALIYSTFLGGSNSTAVYAMAIDGLGNAYVTGATAANDFPEVNPLQGPIPPGGTPGIDQGPACTTFVSKVNPSGTALVYSTLIGQLFLEGSFQPDPGGHGITIDGTGNAYVTGSISAAFPLVNPLSTTGGGYTLKINPAGSALIFSTAGYGGGALALDPSGNLWVPSAYSVEQGMLVEQGTVAQLKGDGSQVLATRTVVNPFSSSVSENCCVFSGFATDSSGNLYMAGGNYGAPVVLSHPLLSVAPASGINGFVARLSPTGNGVAYGVASANLPVTISYSIAGTGCNSGTYPLGSFVDVISGSTCSVSIPTQIGSNGERYLFYNWSDGSTANPRTVTPVADSFLQASFASETQILGSITPAGGGSFTTSPTSPDGYFYSNTQVTVTAVPSPGYSFASITAGNVTYTNTNQITVTVPTTVTAAFSACTYSLSASGIAVPAVATTQSVGVVTGAGCAWVETSNVPWISVTALSAGSGSGTAIFSVATNTSAASRTGTLTIAGQTFTVMQGWGPAVSVFNTGVTPTGLAADGAVDSNYTLIGSADPAFPGPNAFVVDSNMFPFPYWLSDGPNSKWIAPQADEFNFDPPGTYTYSTTFNLTGKVASGAVLNGQCATDNTGVINLNGIPIGSCANFNVWTPFAASSGFVSGVNTLDIVVTNSGSTPSPTGLRVEIYASAPKTPAEAGIFRAGSQWLLDANGNHQYDGPPQDIYYVNFVTPAAGDIPVAGDWSGSGTTKIGIYRPSTGQWFLDYNGDGVFDAGDKTYNFGGIAGDLPVVGDWSGSGFAKVGIFREGFFWILDYNGDGMFDTGDQAFAYGGVAGDVPVSGDWSGDGKAKVGVVRPFSTGGVPAFWLLDANNDHAIDAGDLIFAYGGIAGDVPVVGDWNGTGTAKAGIFRQGFFWIEDYNGSAPATLGGTDTVAFAYGGIAGDVPAVGVWR